MDPLVISLLAASSRPYALSFVASATSTSSTITIPASAQAGDVAILYDVAYNFSGVPTSVTPTGWTAIRSDSGSVSRQNSSAKVLVAADASASITGMTGTSWVNKTLIVVRPNVPAQSFVAAGANGEITAGTPTNQSVTASAGSAPLIVVAGYTITGSFGTVTFSPTQDATITNGTDQQLRYKIYNSAPADVTVGMSDAGINWMQSFYLQVY